MKFLDKIKSVSGFPAEIVAVEYHFGEDGVSLYAAHLKCRKEQVELLGTFSGKGLKELTVFLKKPLPLIVLVSGKKVLVKEASDQGNGFSHQEIISRAFPNISVSELQFQINRLEAGKIKVAAIRSEVIQEVLQQFHSLKLQVTDINLGLYGLWPLLSRSGDPSLRLGFHQVDVPALQITPATEEETSETTLYGETLGAHLICPFLNGLRFFADKKYSSAISQVKHQRNEWQYGKLYRKVLKTGTGALLVILLCSYLLFSHYGEKNASLTTVIGSYETQLKQLDQLQSRYQEKNNFLSVNGENGIQFAKMADDLAAGVPKAIALQDLSFFPVEKRLKKANLIRYYRDRVEISGISNDYAQFRQWITRIKALEWCEDIRILGYQEKDTHDQAEFNLLIMLKNEGPGP